MSTSRYDFRFHKPLSVPIIYVYWSNGVSVATQALRQELDEFLTSALGRGECSAARSGQFIPRETPAAPTGQEDVWSPQTARALPGIVQFHNQPFLRS
jgi:hypothetical protein